MDIFSNKNKLMVILLVLWGIAITLRLTIFNTKQATLPLKYQSIQDKDKNSKENIFKNQVLAEVKLSLLNHPKMKYEENFKNIFKPLIAPPEVKPSPPKPVPPKPAASKNGFLEEEMKKFQFIGFSKNKGETQVFLSKDDNLYVVKKGENIENKFRVKEINQTEIVIAPVDNAEIEFKLNLKEESQSSFNYIPPVQPQNPEFNEPPQMNPQFPGPEDSPPSEPEERSLSEPAEPPDIPPVDPRMRKFSREKIPRMPEDRDNIPEEK